MEPGGRALMVLYLASPPRFFQNRKDGESPEFCILIKMVPRLVYYHSEEFFHLWDQPPSTGGSTSLSHSHREPISAVTISVLPGLGAVGAGTGISSLVLLTLGTQS